MKTPPNQPTTVKEREDFYGVSEGERAIPYFKERNKRMNKYLDSVKNQPTPKPSMSKENINSKLGLPFGKMKKVIIAFDVDGTLRNNEQEEIIANEDIRTLLKILSKFKNTKIVVWSGSGELYARQVAEKLHIVHFVDAFASKTAHKEINPDIAIDDIQDTAIGKINLIVKEKSYE